MRNSIKQFLLILFLVLGILYLFFHGMSAAKEILAPVFLALILSMMLVPVSCFLENKGLKRGWAAFLSDLLFVLFVLTVFIAVGMEVEKLSSHWPGIQERFSSGVHTLESNIERHTGLSVKESFAQFSFLWEEQGGAHEGSELLQQQENKAVPEESEEGQRIPLRDWLGSVLSSVFNSVAKFLLVGVYIFFMLLYRGKFRKAVLKFIPEEQQARGKDILSEIILDARQFLFGNFLLVGILTIVYSIGFYLSGMKGFFTTAFLAAALNLIPYVGNIIAGIIVPGLAFVTTGAVKPVWIVVATIVVAQLLESYVIEPYLVGKRVKVNPLFTIFSIIVGAAVWGVIGMIVFLPLFSFIKAVADRVPMLHPLGYAIGNEDAAEGEGPASRLVGKVKSWFS